MKIYTITHDNHGYDYFLGHTIAANSEDEVRALAKRASADEGHKAWDDASIVEEGIYTGDFTEPFIIMSDFNAG